MTTEALLVLLGGLAAMLFFVSIYVDERWRPDEGRMGPTGRGLYRSWKRGLKLIQVSVGLSVVGAIVVSLGYAVYERWLPHDVMQEIVALRGSDTDGVFVALDEKCASDYEDSSHEQGSKSKSD